MRARAVRPENAEKTVRDIRRATRRQYSAEEKLESLRGEASIAVGGAFIDGKVLIGDCSLRASNTYNRKLA